MPKGSEQKPGGCGGTRDPQQESEKFRSFFSTSVAQVPEALCRTQETKAQDSGRFSLTRLLGRGGKTASEEEEPTERATRCTLGDATGEILLFMEDQQEEPNRRPARQTKEVYGAVPLLEDLERVLGAEPEKPQPKPRASAPKPQAVQTPEIPRQKVQAAAQPAPRAPEKPQAAPQPRQKPQTEARPQPAFKAAAAPARSAPEDKGTRRQPPQEDQKLLDFKAMLEEMSTAPSRTNQEKQDRTVTLADLESRLKTQPARNYGTPSAFFASDVLTEETRPTGRTPAKPEAKPVQAAPAAKPEAKPVQAASAAKPEAKPMQAAPAVKPEAKPVQAAPAAKPEAKPVQAAPAAKPEAKPVQAAPAAKPETKPVQPAPESLPEKKAAPAAPEKPARKKGFFRFFGPAEDELPEKAPAAQPAETAGESCPEDTLSLPLIGLEEEASAPAASAAPRAEAPQQEKRETQPAPENDSASSPETAETETTQAEQTAEDVGRNLHSTGAALTLRCVLGGILAAALLGMGFVFEGLLPPLSMLDPVSAPTAFLGANLLLLLAAMAVSYNVLRDGLAGLRGAPSLDTLPALASLGALVQAVVALLQAESYQASSYRLMSGAAALLLALDLLGSRVLLSAVQGGYELIQSGVDHQGAFRVKDPDLIRCLSADLEEKDPWVLLSRPVHWAASFIDQSFSPRACEKTARKMSWLVLGGSILAALSALLTGRGAAGASAALAAMLCLGAPLSATLIAGLSNLRMQHDAGRVGAVIPGWAAVEELGGVDTLQLDAGELFAPDSAQLKDIRIFKGGRIDRAILYAASVLNQGCNTLSGLFRQIIEDRTDILLPVKDLERRPGLGFAAWCDSQHILIGTRAFMEQEEIPLPEPEYEAKHSKDGTYQVLYLAVSGNLHAMFVVQYLGGRHAAHSLSLLQKENIRLLVSCEDPSLTAEKIAAVYHLPEGMVTVLGPDQIAALQPVQQYAAEAECCMIHLKGLSSLTEGLCAAERAQSAELLGTRVQLVSVILSVVIGLLLTYAGNIGLLSLAVVLMYQAAWSALSIAVAAMKQHG